MLWDFVCSCTRSVRQRTGHSNNDNAHLKKVRIYFALCTLLFTTNPSCSTNLHHFVAETTEVMGGSRKLIKVLRVSVANDTHDELVTTVAETQSLWVELSPCTFTIL